MNRIILSTLILCLLSSCGQTTVSSGPSVSLGPVEVGLYLNSNGEFELDTTISIPIVPTKELGAGISWDIAFSTVLNEASDKENYLIVLWQDEDDSIREQDFSINRPFEINFEHDQWVRKIQRLDNGSIVVFVEKQELVQEEPGNATPDAGSDSYWCDDLSYVRLAVGDRIKVVALKANLRSEPIVPAEFYGNSIAKLEQGTSLTIIGGPTCAHNGTWWEVSTEGGQTGWVREYISAGYLIKH